jgi:type I restriction-modification system DNA methylase subunit
MSRAPPDPKSAPDEIARHLQRITHQHFFRTFEDWLALAVNAFLRDEDAYMAIMRRYGPREKSMHEKDHPADHLARALGAWMRAMQAEPADYLGRVYEEQAIANHYSGQFFTPEPLVELMAAMTMPEELSNDSIVSDPACGSGRLLIAGIRRNRFATFVGVDTDLTCVHMTTLNCLVRNANTWIVHGNSLSLEAWRGYHVRRTPFGGELHRLSQEDAGRILQPPFKTQEASTALSSAGGTTKPLASAPTIQEAYQEARAAFDEVSRQFTTNKRGQGDFGF